MQLARPNSLIPCNLYATPSAPKRGRFYLGGAYDRHAIIGILAAVAILRQKVTNGSVRTHEQDVCRLGHVLRNRQGELGWRAAQSFHRANDGQTECGCQTNAGWQA